MSITWIKGFFGGEKTKYSIECDDLNKINH